MKIIWLCVFAFIVAVSTAVMDMRGSVFFDNDQMTSAPQFEAAFQTDSIYSHSERFNKNSNLIAQDFIPIVVLADASDLSHNFSYYLSLYKLYRQKEYFLLI